ncbi:MAG: translation elongation factor Ts [Phycisphaeraceae bacterium]|nr:MAG: translation elongation factor Ts [Phycisphaeraceae bacterium]
MAEISAKDVMNLRNRTGLGMMECKKALVEAEGDVEKAEDLLRKAYKGKMEKRADRAAGEGRVAVKVAGDGSGAALVELRTETDFTAKNENFIACADTCADEALRAAVGPVSATAAMEAAIDKIRAQTGENISLGRAEKVDGAGVNFGSYVHHDGKTGVLLVVEGDLSDDVKRQICMHITAAVPRPAGVTSDDVPAEVVEKERKFRIEQAMESGKPQEIAEKMVEGGMRKFFAEVALIEQAFVMDPAKKVGDLLGGATVKQFYRWAVGEG